MEVILLGTGGPRPDPRRMATTTLIRLGEENILIDAGRGVMVQLSKAGVPLGSINTVFLTHHHFDHIGDLYDVMLNSWLHGRKDDLRIYGPPDTERLVNTLVTQVYDKDIAWRDQGEPSFGGWKPVVATDIIPGPVLDTGRWKISAELVSHGDGLDMSPAFLARWMCLGYRFEAEGKVIAISGDTVPCPGLQRLAEGADLLVQCCFLATPEIDNEHLRRLAKFTMACGDTVGKVAPTPTSRSSR
jgi:ribonuclease BN (tRNA processing enzyme)